jgi:hypothetical protein
MSGAKKFSELSWFLIILPFLVAYFPVLRTLQSSDPVTYMIPNALLFTGLKELAYQQWDKYLKVNEDVIYEPSPVPVIQSKDFSFEALRRATHNFRYPAVVKGLFLGTPALEKWLDPHYIGSKLAQMGDFKIPVVLSADYGTLQDKRDLVPVAKAFYDVLSNKSSKMYLFFPLSSRVNASDSKVGSAERLKEAVNHLVREDLDLDRIWPGFGTSKHKNYFGSQLIAGQGTNNTEATTGSGWHCAMGNNWFVQVAGRKLWYFLDPPHSSKMHPTRGGLVHMVTGIFGMEKYHRYLPLRVATLEAGDLLYNPDWEWHTIKNYEGLSIGVPLREVNITYAFRNNFQYSAITSINKIAELLGIDVGGYSG